MSESDVGPGVAFQSYLRDGELRLQQCDACKRRIFFPRTICPYCGGLQLTWRPVSGRGVVYSTTVVRQRPERGGDYNIALVDLEEGARMMTRVVDIAPGQVRIGMPVQAAIGELQSEPLVLFRPAEAG